MFIVQGPCHLQLPFRRIILFQNGRPAGLELFESVAAEGNRSGIGKQSVREFIEFGIADGVGAVCEAIESGRAR